MQSSPVATGVALVYIVSCWMAVTTDGGGLVWSGARRADIPLRPDRLEARARAKHFYGKCWRGLWFLTNAILLLIDWLPNQLGSTQGLCSLYLGLLRANIRTCCSVATEAITIKFVWQETFYQFFHFFSLNSSFLVEWKFLKAHHKFHPSALSEVK